MNRKRPSGRDQTAKAIKATAVANPGAAAVVTANPAAENGADPATMEIEIRGVETIEEFFRPEFA